MFFLVEPSHFHHCVPLAPLSASFPNPATRAGYGFTYNNFLEDLSFGSFVFSPFTTNGSQAMSFVTSPSSTAFVLAQQGSGVRHLGCFFRVTWIGVQLVGGGVRLFATGIELTFHDGRGAFHSFYSDVQLELQHNAHACFLSCLQRRSYIGNRLLAHTANPPMFSKVPNLAICVHLDSSSRTIGVYPPSPALAARVSSLFLIVLHQTNITQHCFISMSPEP